VPAFLEGAYPARTTDPEAVARGKALYAAYGCGFCHGQDTRGGNQGPSLLRSQLVQRDRAGETVGPLIRGGVPNTTMVGFALEPEQIADIAEFLHSFALDSRDPARQTPASIVTGNARAGRRYFDAHCAECHSATGDLRGLAARYANAVDLQTNWLMPRNAPPTRVRVTTPDGGVTEGRLARIDEFVVSVALDDGTQRSFEREGALPQVEIQDPLAAHKALLPVYTDPDIHNVTAYLVSIE
jgi:mono/diheme cytochrome c family protein